MRMRALPSQHSDNILPQVFSELCCKVSEEGGQRKGRRREGGEREGREMGGMREKGEREREKGRRKDVGGEEERTVRYKEVGRGRKGGCGGSRGRLLLRFYQHIRTVLIDIVKITAL